MRAEEALRQLENREFLDSLTGFAYHRCRSSHEAEDLCSDILLSLLKSLRQGLEIRDFSAFAWTVARRVYADYCGRRATAANRAGGTLVEETAAVDPIGGLLDREEERAQLARIRREIAFLAKSYRDVMVLFYLEGRSVAAVAVSLGLSQTTVKQRLFTARGMIRKEVEKMEVRDLSLQPVRIHFWGNGSPNGNDPAEVAKRTLSQNLVYLCKNTARSAKELAEQLHVPMLFIEEELAIQCHGLNGDYGLLRRLDNGKYITNIILLDMADYRRVDAVYQRLAPTLADRMQAFLETNADRLTAFPFVSPQDDPAFVAWALVVPAFWGFESRLISLLAGGPFADMARPSRPFSTFGFVGPAGEEWETGGYGCDGIEAREVGGYEQVKMTNLYGRRLPVHFHCGHNLANDPQLLLLLRAVRGLTVSALTEEERETAARSIEEGYLRREGNRLLPRVLMMEASRERAFWKLSEELADEAIPLLEPLADELTGLIRRLVPPHLLAEWPLFVGMTQMGLVERVVELLYERGALTHTDGGSCAEGVWVFLKETEHGSRASAAGCSEAVRNASDA